MVILIRCSRKNSLTDRQALTNKNPFEIHEEKIDAEFAKEFMIDMIESLNCIDFIQNGEFSQKQKSEFDRRMK